MFYFFCLLQVLVVIDAKPKDLGLPTEAYIMVEEVHDVSLEGRSANNVWWGS